VNCDDSVQGRHVSGTLYDISGVHRQTTQRIEQAQAPQLPRATGLPPAASSCHGSCCPPRSTAMRTGLLSRSAVGRGSPKVAARAVNTQQSACQRRGSPPPDNPSPIHFRYFCGSPSVSRRPGYATASQFRPRIGNGCTVRCMSRGYAGGHLGLATASYLQTVGLANLVPRSHSEFAVILHSHLPSFRFAL
jgi:hypothetical protein